MEHIANFVKQTSTSTGTGDFGLTSATGYRDFSTAFGTGGTDVFDYFIRHLDADEWEYGTGHIDSTSGDLVRDTVIDSSNSDSAVSFSSGDKEVVTDIAAERAGLGDPLKTKVVSSDQSNVDFTDSIDGAFSRYDKYKINIINLSVDTDGARLHLRLDAGGGGADFEAGSSDYSWVFDGFNVPSTEWQSGSTGDSKISLTYHNSSGGIDDLSASDFNGEIDLSRPSDSDKNPKIRGNCFYNMKDSELIEAENAGQLLTSTSYNAIRFFLDTGNITSGIFKLYGIG